VARQLYAEIASIEEQHVTQYESLCDPTESLLEKWLLHEVMEVYCYQSCLAYEGNTRIKGIWERFLAYELGQLHYVMELFKEIEGRDPAEVLPATLPEPIAFKSHREFVRRVLNQEVDLRANGTEYVDKAELPPNHRSTLVAQQLNSEGSPSETAAAGYQWTPGTELVKRIDVTADGKAGRIQ